MNPASPSLLLVVALLLVAALVAGVALGLLVARSRTQAAIDAASAQAGHARELELAQARERLRAGEQAAAAAQAELERSRTETRGARDELAAAHDTVLRAAASEAQKNQHVLSLNERVADLEQKARDAAAQIDARNLALQTAHAELAQARTRADAE